MDGLHNNSKYEIPAALILIYTRCARVCCVSSQCGSMSSVCLHWLCVRNVSGLRLSWSQVRRAGGLQSKYALSAEQIAWDKKLGTEGKNKASGLFSK